jgi:hypothetical protein
MNQSKIDLTHRLQREGRWEEASQFKDGEIARLKTEGLKRAEAGQAAWEAMEEKYPPLPAEAASEPPGELLIDDIERTPGNYHLDAQWVYEVLGVRSITAADSPSSGAWALLNWARQNPQRFFEYVLPKALSSAPPVSEVGTGVVIDDVSEIVRLLKSVEECELAD